MTLFTQLRMHSFSRCLPRMNKITPWIVLRHLSACSCRSITAPEVRACRILFRKYARESPLQPRFARNRPKSIENLSTISSLLLARFFASLCAAIRSAINSTARRSSSSAVNCLETSAALRMRFLARMNSITVSSLFRLKSSHRVRLVAWFRILASSCSRRWRWMLSRFFLLRLLRRLSCRKSIWNLAYSL